MAGLLKKGLIVLYKLPLYGAVKLWVRGNGS